ncbi:MAG: hypothetical protein ACHQWV_03765 [Nitrospirales bacterium]
MTKYIKIKENGKVLFKFLEMPEFDFNHKIDEIIALNILRGHDKVTKSHAIRMAIHFYHQQLKEETNVNDEAIHTIPAREDEHADVGDADQ